jgi:RNA polymerase sigma-70 factor (ECF subfamily)
MEVDRHDPITPAMVHFMVAAVIAKTAALTAPPAPVQSIESMETASELRDKRKKEAAFLKAVDDNLGIIIKICRAYNNTRDDEEDLLQEILYRLWKAWPSFQGTAKVSTWMHTVASRTAIRPFRRKKVEIELHEVLPDQVASEPAETEEVERLFDLFHRLGNYERAILALLLEGYTKKEVASMLKFREGAVAMRISRMKKMFDQF